MGVQRWDAQLHGSPFKQQGRRYELNPCNGAQSSPYLCKEASWDVSSTGNCLGCWHLKPTRLNSSPKGLFTNHWESFGPLPLNALRNICRQGKKKKHLALFRSEKIKMAEYLKPTTTTQTSAHYNHPASTAWTVC